MYYHNTSLSDIPIKSTNYVSSFVFYQHKQTGRHWTGITPRGYLNLAWGSNTHWSPFYFILFIWCISQITYFSVHEIKEIVSLWWIELNEVSQLLNLSKCYLESSKFRNDIIGFCCIYLFYLHPKAPNVDWYEYLN